MLASIKPSSKDGNGSFSCFKYHYFRNKIIKSIDELMTENDFQLIQSLLCQLCCIKP